MGNLRQSMPPTLNGVVSPITASSFVAGRRYSASIFDPYASDSSSSDASSPLMKYLRAAAEPPSPPLFVSPVKVVEEDVLVMDAIPLPRSVKRPSESSGSGGYSGGRSSSSSNLVLSSWSGGSGNGSGDSKSKARVCGCCVSGTCRFGSKCQSAHVKEELRPPRVSAKNNRLEIGKLQLSSGGSSSSPHGTKPLRPSKPTPTLSLSSPPAPARMALPASPIEVKSGSDWTPQDDGIEIGKTLPFGAIGKKPPTKEEVDGYIQKLLYGCCSRKRLSAFEEVCPN